MNNDTLDRFFDPENVGLSNERTAEILGVRPQTLATWRSKGRGPMFRKSGRRVEYTPRFNVVHATASFLAVGACLAIKLTT
jgi:hypothetical protein